MRNKDMAMSGSHYLYVKAINLAFWVGRRLMKFAHTFSSKFLWILFAPALVLPFSLSLVITCPLQDCNVPWLGHGVYYRSGKLAVSRDIHLSASIFRKQPTVGVKIYQLMKVLIVPWCPNELLIGSSNHIAIHGGTNTPHWTALMCFWLGLLRMTRTDTCS